ncbi:MAG: Diguanylate cyclase/phosphodiesterase [Bacteroidetes bacterium]|nr:MAG: Diguanylate cyclase/phosphodiesterase [Bacteroidota bacterium]
MKKQSENVTDAARLRQKAEEKLNQQKPETKKMVNETDLLKLIHELEVHQIELEMQNEELVIAKEKAEQAEEKYQELYDFAPSGYFTLSHQGVIVEMNLRGAQMLGKERSLLRNSNFGFFVDKDSRSVFVTFLEEIFQAKNIAICDIPLICKGNTNLYVHLTGIISANKNHCHVTAIDITERKNAEVQLQHAKEKAEESESQFRSLFENAADAIFIADAESGILVNANKTAVNLLNMSIDDIFGKHQSELHPPEMSNYSEATFQKHKVEIGEEKVAYPVENYVLRSDGTQIPVEVTGSRVFYNGRDCIMGIFRDITERKLAEDALKESESRFKNMFEEHNAIMLLINPESGNIIEANEASSRFYGYSKAELVTMNIDKLNILSFEQINMELEHAFHQKRNYFVFQHRLANGEVRLVEVHSTPIHYQDQRILFSIIHDITDRKQAEQRLKRIEWLLTSRPKVSETKEQTYMPPYGDLVALNTSRLILNSVGVQTLTDIVGDYLNLLDTSSAVYEKNGDYALGIFSSGWCRFMDTASRNVCGTDDNSEALECGRWLCHESCWSRASKTAIESGQPADIECDGGIRLYAAPIRVGDDIIGAINFGYGDPPRDERKLRELATLYQVSYDELRTHALNYESRPPYIVDLAKNRLLSSARLIGEIVERKQAEEEIKKTGQHYQALIEKAPDGIALIDAEGNFKYISPAAKKMFGYKQTDKVSGNPAEYTHPDDLQMVVSELGKIFENPAYIPTLEYRFIDKSGNWHWVETTFSNLLAHPSVESIVLNFRDITERKLIEETQAFLLQISNPGSDENFFELLAKYLSQCLDMEYVCIDLLEGDRLTAKTLAIYNEGNFDPNVSYALKDTPCGEVVGNHICCYPQKVRSLFPNDPALEDIKAESYIGTTLWSFDGQPIGLIALIGQKPLQNQELSASVLKLVSLRAAGKLEATLSEEKVRESEEKFRVLIESTSVGIYLTDLNGKCTYVNPKWCEMAQLSYNQALEEGWVKGIYEEDREKVLENWQKMIASDGNWGFEYRFGTSDKISWVYGTVKSYKNDSGQIVGYIGSNVDITERKQSEAIIRDIIEKNPMSIQILDMEGYPTQINPAHTRLFGVEPPSDYSIFKDTQLLALGFDEFFSRIKKGEVVYFPDTYYNVHDVDPSFPDSPVWVKALGFTLNDNNGNPNKIVLMHENITERKNAEALLNDIIENNPLSIQVVDKKGYTLRGNPAFIELFGSVPPPEFSIFDDLKSKSIELENLVNQVKNGELVHLPDIYFNAHDAIIEAPDIPVWVRALIFPLNDSSGKPERFVFMHENITDRKIAEQELIAAKEHAENNNRINEARLKLLQFSENHTIDEILEETLNTAEVISQSKIGFFHFVEQDQINLLLQNWSTGTKKYYCNTKGKGLHYPIDKAGVWVDCVSERKPVIHNNYEGLKHKKGLPEGHAALIRELVVPIIYDGVVKAIFGIGNKETDYNQIDVENISLLAYLAWEMVEKKKISKELVFAKEKAEESDRLKSAFLANMSHEIRTPMNGILGFAELLNEPDLTGDEQQKCIDMIGKSGKRMLNIINDIVDISRIEAGLMKLDISESNVNEQIEYIYTFFKPEVKAKGIKLSFRNSLTAKEAIIKTDREKLYAILTNLVKNAIKYTSEGSIEFGYSVVTMHELPQLQFYVKDTGIGIPKDRQEAIFERFIQADIADKMARQGAGLGLAITKSYIEMLGGKIWVESEEGIGSTFYFTLPYTIESLKESIEQQTEPSENNETIRKLKILIAEDDEVSEMLINSYIKKFGKEILKARTGVEAVEICRDNPDIDLILMDIRMPEMNGYEATKEIRQFNKDVVIIAQTAYGLTGESAKAIKSGCNDYISKPIKKSELLRLLQKNLN